MTDPEEQARAIGESKTLLKKRLLEARSVLNTEGRKAFRKYTFDFDNKRLVSEDGKLVLQWRVRRHPSWPESYKNQQTNTGTVLLLEDIYDVLRGGDANNAR